MATNWAVFAAGALEAPAGATVTRYTVAESRAVIGAAPVIAPGMAFTRVESTEPVVLAGAAPETQFRGTAQHLNYTAAPQRADLEARSTGPFTPEPGLWCVMIPIHKTAAWWQLAPGARTAHFQRAEQHHQHVAIGAPYVERIYRKLYHSRYHGGAEAPIPYDFVTYFEFLEPDRPAFEELLAGLRDTSINPEWAYVDMEFEVWLRRV